MNGYSYCDEDEYGSEGPVVGNEDGTADKADP